MKPDFVHEKRKVDRVSDGASLGFEVTPSPLVAPCAPARINDEVLIVSP